VNLIDSELHLRQETLDFARELLVPSSTFRVAVAGCFDDRDQTNFIVSKHILS
jgi:hypothetical protein